MKIEGLSDLVAHVQDAGPRFDKEFRGAMTLAMFKVEAEAKARTPVVTRRLFSSIATELISTSPLIGAVGTKVKYGPMIEYGAPAGFPIEYKQGRRTRYGRTRAYTAHLRSARVGRRFLRGGLEASTQYIETLFRDAADRVLASFKGK